MLVSGMRIDGESNGRPVRITTHSDEWGDQVRVHGFVQEGLESPALHDPATLGCLLALVRDAHGSPLLRVEGFPDGWRAVQTDRAPYIVGLGSTEAAALVAALEAAP